MNEIKAKSMLQKVCSWLYNHFPFMNKINNKGKNKIVLGQAFLKHCQITCKGKGNLICFESGHFINCKFVINGDGNRITISRDVNARGVRLFVSQNDNRVIIGKKTTFAGDIYLGCMEKTSLIIGEGCLFSNGIQVRTSDSHSILDADNNRINPAKDIIIGDRVWRCHGAAILKGSKIQADSVVGGGAIVNQLIDKSNVILAGIPAKIVKENIHWSSEKL